MTNLLPFIIVDMQFDVEGFPGRPTIIIKNVIKDNITRTGRQLTLVPWLL